MQLFAFDLINKIVLSALCFNTIFQMSLSIKQELLSPYLDLCQYESLGSSNMFTTYDCKIVNQSTYKKRGNHSFVKSFGSNKSKYTSSSKLTKSRIYESLRKGSHGKQQRKQQELDIQVNLLKEGLQVLNKQLYSQNAKICKFFKELANQANMLENKLRQK